MKTQLDWMGEVTGRMKQDWWTLPLTNPKADRDSVSIIEKEDGIYKFNKITGAEIKLYEPQVGGKHIKFGTCNNICTKEDVEKAIPDLPGTDFPAYRNDGRYDLADAIKKGIGKELYYYRHISSPLWTCVLLWGFEEFMIKTNTEPELVRYACERYLERRIQEIYLAADMGCEAIWIEECILDMLSPDVYRSMNVPYLSVIAEEIQKLGMKSILYFCGNPNGKASGLLLAQVGYNGASRPFINCGDIAVVIGDGLVRQYCAQVLKHRNAYVLLSGRL